MEQLKARWSALSPRERVLLSVLIVVITTYLIFKFIWIPLDQAADKQVSSVQERIDLYTALEPRLNAAKIALEAKEGSESIITFSGNAMVTVDESVKEQGLSSHLSLLSPNENSLSVWFTNIEFNKWVNWVGTMRDKGIIVTEAKSTLTKDRPGIVNIKALVTPVK